MNIEEIQAAIKKRIGQIQDIIPSFKKYPDNKEYSNLKRAVYELSWVLSLIKKTKRRSRGR